MGIGAPKKQLTWFVVQQTRLRTRRHRRMQALHTAGPTHRRTQALHAAGCTCRRMPSSHAGFAHVAYRSTNLNSQCFLFFCVTQFTNFTVLCNFVHKFTKFHRLVHTHVHTYQQKPKVSFCVKQFTKFVKHIFINPFSDFWRQRTRVYTSTYQQSW